MSASGSVGARGGSIAELTGPVNTCEFKIHMELQHEAGHYLKIKYDWINVVNGPDGREISFPVIDTGFFKDWNLV